MTPGNRTSRNEFRAATLTRRSAPKRTARRGGSHGPYSPHKHRDVLHLEPHGYRVAGGTTSLSTPSAPGRPFRNATVSDSQDSSPRLRPIGSFRVSSATTPRAGMRSTLADMRCRGVIRPCVAVRGTPRTTRLSWPTPGVNHGRYRSVYACPPFTDRPFDRTHCSTLGSTSECPPRGCP